MEDSASVKITFYNQNLDQDNSILGTMGIHVTSLDLFLSKAKLIRKKDGGLYVAPPAERYICKKTGQTKYANMWWFGEKFSQPFQDHVKLALQKYFSEKKLKDPWETDAPSS